jgi:N-methylhydantoinase A/oxoprolinase/acetone carboxylase beta subunit
MIRIGIDVGGTNTDAVLLDGSAVLHATKTPTTADVTAGIAAALRATLAVTRIAPARIAAVMIGTTHFTNAVVQRRDLTPIAAIRIGLPATATLPPFIDWPPDLRAVVQGPIAMLRGGHEVDGRPLVPFDEAAMREAAESLAKAGIQAAAITAVFSPLNAEAERQAAGILAAAVPHLAITLSHELGRIGLLARENVALLNAALIPLARRTVAAFRAALAQEGIAAPLFITQNDGTVATADEAAAFPVRSFASGPTNSLRGAAFLSGLADAMVADVGGTTTDVGSLVQGFPREANNVVHVGGVRTLFRMPDLVSVGLGGGTLVNPADANDIGPHSVGYRLPERARVFGGPDLTCTDIAVAAGLISLGNPALVAELPTGFVAAALARIHAIIADAVDRMRADATPRPLVAVGGAAFLVPDRMPGISEIIRVPNQGVANALGAAIAQVSGEIDQVFQGLPRDAALAQARHLATQRAIRAGADPATITLVDQEDIPIAYLPGNSLRIRARVVGDVAG